MHVDDLLTPFAIYLRICYAKTASLRSSKVTQFSVLLNGGRGSGSKRKFSAMAADEQACRLCRQNLGNLINLTTLACGCHFHTRCFATQMFFSHMTKEGGDADTPGYSPYVYPHPRHGNNVPLTMDTFTTGAGTRHSRG